MISPDDVKRWMAGPEGHHIEFKEAKTQIDSTELARYCVALANEGGGHLVLGVSNQRPRQIVGSRALPSPDKERAELLDRLGIRIDVVEVFVGEQRVVVLDVPPRPVGCPIHYRGAYWMRSGEQLVPMTSDHLRRIFDESGPDFSAEVCPQARMDDLDPGAVASLRSMWHRRSGNRSLLDLPDVRLLEDAELTIGGAVTYAALVLLGRPRVLSRLLPQAEVIFEYRSAEASGPAQQRIELRKGFMLYVDELWNAINLRNELQHYQQGFVVFDIPSFNESIVREAILNAIAHRDYRRGESVFVRQFPRRLEVISPGGFPTGITIDNVLNRQAPRNRRIAETFAKCGLVERAGQGMNRMFELSVRESKPLPDFAGTDEHQVSVTLHGNVQDPEFVRYLEVIGRERTESYSTTDFVLLDVVRRQQPIPEALRGRAHTLVEQGVIERVGRGRGTRYILARRFYALSGAKGEYTRVRGLDRETNKQLLLRHIYDNRKSGSPFRDLAGVLPNETRSTIQALLREMQRGGSVHCVGRTRAALWYPGPRPRD